MRGIPRRFKAVATDRVISMLAHYGDMMLQVEMEFEHDLDVERMRRAQDLLYDAEPILGCRFVPHAVTPCWERVDRHGAERFHVAADAAEYESFRLRTLDTHAGPQVETCLWKPGGGNRLLVKISHHVADAGGCKHVCSILSSLYSRLAREPRFVPEPNCSGSRGAWQVLKRIPVTSFPRIYMNFLREQWSNLVPLQTHRLALSRLAERCAPTYLIRHVSPERVGEMARRGRSQGATINDLLAAAFLAALVRVVDWDGKSALRIGTTVDLRRRYLPEGRAEAVCNLSAIEYVHLSRDPNPDFSSILAQVTSITKKRKADFLGLSGYVGVMPALRLLPFRLGKGLMCRLGDRALEKGNFGHIITNMGPIDPEDICFDRPPASAWILTPPIYGPLFGIGFTGYKGGLSISAGIYPPEIQVEKVERLFDEMLAPLPG